MAVRKRQPRRTGSAREDPQREDHADHGEPPAVPGVAPPSTPPSADEPAAGRQPQRPGQDARFEERPGGREHTSGGAVPTTPKKR